jgi:hypothetical protein
MAAGILCFQDPLAFLASRSGLNPRAGAIGPRERPILSVMKGICRRVCKIRCFRTLESSLGRPIRGAAKEGQVERSAAPDVNLFLESAKIDIFFPIKFAENAK